MQAQQCLAQPREAVRPQFDKLKQSIIAYIYFVNKTTLPCWSRLTYFISQVGRPLWEFSYLFPDDRSYFHNIQPHKTITNTCISTESKGTTGHWLRPEVKSYSKVMEVMGTCLQQLAATPDLFIYFLPLNSWAGKSSSISDTFCSPSTLLLDPTMNFTASELWTSEIWGLIVVGIHNSIAKRSSYLLIQPSAYVPKGVHSPSQLFGDDTVRRVPITNLAWIPSAGSHCSPRHKVASSLQHAPHCTVSSTTCLENRMSPGTDASWV